MRCDNKIVWDLRFRRDLTDKEALELVSLLALLEDMCSNVLFTYSDFQILVVGQGWGLFSCIALFIHEWWRYLGGMS